MSEINNEIQIQNESIPNTVTINKYTYKYKDKLKNNFFTYRCINRKTCGAVIKIELSQLLKIREKKDANIEFVLTGAKKTHTCLNQENNNIENESDNKDTQVNEILDKKELQLEKEILIKSLIINNIQKPLKFHINNFKSNNINLTKNQVKWNLQKIREQNFPNNNEYLKNISNITITFESSDNLENIPLCHKMVNLINPEKKIKRINI